MALMIWGIFNGCGRAAQYINREEGAPADELVLLAAAYFHDLVSLPKNHPQRSAASLMSAERTSGMTRNFSEIKRVTRSVSSSRDPGGSSTASSARP